MSTEQPPTEQPPTTGRPAIARRSSDQPTKRGADRRWRRYRRTTTATIAVLALLSVGLGAAAVLRGPTIDSASINLPAVIARDGQKLVLHADQSLAPITPDQVSVSPAAPVDVTASGPDVTLAFSGLLDYATTYHVRVDGVVGADTGLSGSLDYSFDTPDVPVYTLLRQGGAAARDPGRPEDQVLRSGIAAGPDATSEVVFEAPHILQYAVTDVALAAIVADDQGNTSLEVVPDGGSAVTVPTPSGARLQNLRSSPTSRLFGFTVSGGADAAGTPYQDAVFVFDPLSASGRADPVAGFGGAPLPLVDWRFVPGTSSLVGQGSDQQLYLVDPLKGGEPTPLGRHTQMRGFLPGGVQLVVADGEGESTIDLSTGAVTALPVFVPVVDPKYYPKKIVVQAGGVTIRQYDDVDYSSDSPVAASVIALADAAGTRELYRSTTAGSRVRDFCVSPNGQYLAVEVVPAGALNDGYALPGYSDMSTYFVDIASGATTRGVAGFLPDWCG